MSQDLRSLERDVEQARSRLVGDLARLRSPTTVARFKDDAWQDVRSVKDAAVAKAQDTLMDGVHRLAADLKARAAANPAAALAIGAGVAWRLLRHPPIASALVGIGAYSLWRTDPAEGPNPMVTRAAELTDAARERLEDWTETARSTIAYAREEGPSIAEDGMRRGAQTATDAVEAMQGTTRDAVEAVQGATSKAVGAVQDAVHEAGVQVRAQAMRATESARRLANGQETRDTALLGIAALAIAAAAGIAYQRRGLDAS
jgi:hypothetical protein